jgi:DNA-binding LytR/AlgR family response regulator
MKLQCIIVDDEPLARKGMQEYVQDISFLHLAGSFESANQAKEFLQHQSADLMLLDIRMPGISGIEFLKTLPHPPLAIVTTAYTEHALEGFELDVIDYLIKPISFERFKKATQKALDYFSLRQPTQSDPVDFFFIKCNHKFERVNYAELLFVEAMQNYCIIHTSGRKLIAYITLTGLMEKLPAHCFIKVHKSFIVSIDKVNALDGNEIIIGTSRIPVSRTLKDEVMARILGNNLLGR